MTVYESRVRNGFVRLHYLDSAPDAPPETGRPLLIVPGTSEAAEDYLDLLEALAPRLACISPVLLPVVAGPVCS